MKTSFRTKLFGVVLPAIALLVGLGWILVQDRRSTAAEAGRTKREALVAASAMQLRDEIQNETRQGVLLLNAPTADSGVFIAQRGTTDELAAKLLRELDGLSASVLKSDEVGAARKALKSDLVDARAKVGTRDLNEAQRTVAVYDLVDEATAALSSALVSARGSTTSAASSAELQAFLRAKGDYNRELLYPVTRLNGSDLTPADAAVFLEVQAAANRSFARLRLSARTSTTDALVPFFENQIADIKPLGESFTVNANRSQASPFFTAAEWLKRGDASFKQLDDLEDSLFNDFAAQAARDEASAQNSATLFIILTALGTLLVMLGAFLIGRNLSRRLRKVTDAAHDIAVDRLPEVLESLRNPTAETIAKAIPQIESTGKDEVGQLANDFNKVLRTAIETSVEHSQRRAATLTNLLVNLGRRNQSLIDKQLELIDGLESNQQDPELLAGLFKLDHMVTRQRRNAESLLVLAGSRRSRAWTDALPISDVLRGAISEVNQMERIQLEIQPGNDLVFAGTHAVDLSHLIAELLENATLYSSPATTVTLRVQRNALQFRVWVIDSGVGMTDDELGAANHRVLDPPDIDEITTDQVGFQVVGRLAQRIGARVRLQNNPAGGVAVSVDLPPASFEAMPEAPRRRETPVETPLPDLDDDAMWSNAAEPSVNGNGHANGHTNGQNGKNGSYINGGSNGHDAASAPALPKRRPASDVPASDVPANDVPANDVPANDSPAEPVPAVTMSAMAMPAVATPATELVRTAAPSVPIVPPMVVPLPKRSVVRMDEASTPAPRAERPNGERPNGERPNGERPNGERPNGEQADGERPLARRRPNQSANPAAAAAAEEGAFLRLPTGNSAPAGESDATRRRQILSDFKRGVGDAMHDNTNRIDDTTQNNNGKGKGK
jgi:HAMP domain-containing protein/anti-sigma regulatory factor (Ser/Thr protein kinase)